MGKNRYIRDKYKSRPLPRSVDQGRGASSSSPRRRKILLLAVGLAVLLVAVWFMVSGPDHAAPPDESPDRIGLNGREAELYAQAVAAPENDPAAKAQLYAQLMELDPDNAEYRARHAHYAELLAQETRARERELLDRLEFVPPEDNATHVAIYARLMALDPANAQYSATYEDYAARLKEQARQEEEALYAMVLEVPAEDYAANMAYYARLMELNPDKDLYRQKYEHYAAKMAEERRAREQLLLEQVGQIPAEDSETNMLFYKELMELNPDEPSYREKHDMYAARLAQERSVQEQELYEQVRLVPAEDYETNMVLYEQLMELNPDEPMYREKYEHYLQRFYEAKGIEPPPDIEALERDQ